LELRTDTGVVLLSSDQITLGSSELKAFATTGYPDMSFCTLRALYIGDEKLNSGSSQLTAFLGGVGTALTNTGSDAVIQFRGCQIGDNKSFLQELAAGTGHNVTGLEGDIKLPWLAYILSGLPGGPDYSFDALYIA